MPSLGRRNRDRHALRITHLADHQYIRRLPQRRAESGRKIRRISSNLDLLDDAAHVRVFVFDRIFNGHDVARIALVDLIDQSRQCRGFPRASRASNQNQPAPYTRQIANLSRKTQLSERRNLHRKRADGRRGTPALAMQINPKSAKTRNTIRRVGNLSGAILSGANRGQNRLHPRFDFRTIQRRVADLLDLSIFANRSRRAVNQQQVAAAATQQLRQKIMQL